MGYALSLLTIDRTQLQHLQQNPAHTDDYLHGRMRMHEVSESVKGWFRTTEVKKTVPVDLPCPWPDSEPAQVYLYSRAGLHHLLTGTDERCEGVTSYPNAGLRYPDDKLGLAVELGPTGFCNAHAFLPETVLELQAALHDIGDDIVAARAQHPAQKMEWPDALDQVPEDMNVLRELVSEAVRDGKGLLWYWA